LKGSFTLGSHQNLCDDIINHDQLPSDTTGQSINLTATTTNERKIASQPTVQFNGNGHRTDERSSLTNGSQPTEQFNDYDHFQAIGHRNSFQQPPGGVGNQHSQYWNNSSSSTTYYTESRYHHIAYGNINNQETLLLHQCSQAMNNMNTIHWEYRRIR
jgi:hypothetical protein